MRLARLASIVVVVVALGSCGGAPKPEPDPDPTPVTPTETRSALQIRQEAACEQVGKRATACAIADTMQQTPEERAKADVEHTAAINTREYIKGCVGQYMSSRQVRVFEVCLREETDCDPFLACLDNAQPQK